MNGQVHFEFKNLFRLQRYALPALKTNTEADIIAMERNMSSFASEFGRYCSERL